MVTKICLQLEGQEKICCLISVKLGLDFVVCDVTPVAIGLIQALAFDLCEYLPLLALFASMPRQSKRQRQMVPMAGPGNMMTMPMPTMPAMPPMQHMPTMPMQQMMMGMPSMPTLPESESDSDTPDASAAASGAAPVTPSVNPIPAVAPAPPLMPVALAAPPPFVMEDASVVTRSASMVKSLPRARLSEALEFVDGRFDATFTSELSQVGLLAMVFVWCRIKPSVRICDLRGWTEKRKLLWFCLCCFGI